MKPKIIFNTGKINKPPVSLSKIVAVTANEHSAKAYEGKIRAVVATVTDDNRLCSSPEYNPYLRQHDVD